MRFGVWFDVLELFFTKKHVPALAGVLVNGSDKNYPSLLSVQIRVVSIVLLSIVLLK